MHLIAISLGMLISCSATPLLADEEYHHHNHHHRRPHPHGRHPHKAESKSDVTININGGDNNQGGTSDAESPQLVPMVTGTAGFFGGVALIVYGVANNDAAMGIGGAAETVLSAFSAMNNPRTSSPATNTTYMFLNTVGAIGSGVVTGLMFVNNPSAWVLAPLAYVVTHAVDVAYRAMTPTKKS